MSAMLQLLISGYTAPRAALASVRAAPHPIAVIVLAVVLAYLVKVITMSAMGALPDMNERSIVGFHLRAFLQHAAQFVIMGTVIYWGARMAGGSAKRLDTMLMTAWYTLVISFLMPLFVGLSPNMEAALQSMQDGEEAEISGLTLLLVFSATALQLWLLAVNVAALNGFSKIWAVIGGVLLAQIAVGVLLLMFGLTPS